MPELVNKKVDKIIGTSGEPTILCVGKILISVASVI